MGFLIPVRSPWLGPRVGTFPLLVTGRAQVSIFKWFSEGLWGNWVSRGPFSQPGPGCPTQAKSPREAVRWQPCWSRQSCIFLLITAYLQAEGKCGLGRKGLMNKVETGCHLRSLPVHFLPIAACSVIGQSPPQDSTLSQATYPSPFPRKGRGWGWPAIRF